MGVMQMRIYRIVQHFMSSSPASLCRTDVGLFGAGRFAGFEKVGRR